MEIEIRRTPSTVYGTFGKLFIDNVYACETLEDVVTERDGVPVAEWKVAGESAIPKGRYRVTISHSPRFKRELPLLSAVPGFSGVRIHAGNTDKDTEGCILVGVAQDGQRLSQSRVAFDELFRDIREAIDNGEQVWITVG